VPLLWLTTRADLMGEHRNRWWTTAVGVLVAGLLITLNVVLLYLTFTGAG
jgi:manganese transport protein